MISRIIRLVFLFSFAMPAAARAAVPAIALDGSTTVGPIAKSFAVYFMKKYGIPVTVSESGSGNGAKSLINGSCTIATMSRAMKDKEIAAARKQGVVPVPRVVALDGLAIVVYPGNPVSSLSRAQISAIYRGATRNWKQVGGPDVPIVVIQRESNSGTQEAFKSLIIGKGVPITGRAETQASNGAVKNRVSATPSAIGFLGLGYLDQSVKAIAVDGVVPGLKTVKNHTYPVTRPLFFYTAGQPSGYVQKFVELSDTAEGRQIITELGFISP